MSILNNNVTTLLLEVTFDVKNSLKGKKSVRHLIKVHCQRNKRLRKGIFWIVFNPRFLISICKKSKLKENKSKSSILSPMHQLFN